MANSIKNYIKESRAQEVDALLESSIKSLESEGLSVEFGKIGQHTTYAMIYNEDHTTELVGYTFVKNLKFYKENVGKYRALQQAMARKELAESAE